MIIGVAFELQDGTVLSLPKPNRHHHIIKMMSENGYTRGDVARATQGFITDYGEFLDREAGAEYALTCCQITKLSWPPRLYSEDLW